MELDRLLAILAGPNPRYATRQLMADGHSEDEVRGAWNFARAAGSPSRGGWKRTDLPRPGGGAPRRSRRDEN